MIVVFRDPIVSGNILNSISARSLALPPGNTLHVIDLLQLGATVRVMQIRQLLSDTSGRNFDPLVMQ